MGAAPPMREHYFITESGKRIAVCNMQTNQILDVLRDGIELDFSVPEMPCTVKDVERRLFLELEIRALGLDSKKEKIL